MHCEKSGMEKKGTKSLVKYFFLESIWDEWIKIDAKEFAKQKQARQQNYQEEDDGLHILKVPQDLVDGTLMVPNEAMKTTTLVSYDEVDKAFAEV